MINTLVNIYSVILTIYYANSPTASIEHLLKLLALHELASLFLCNDVKWVLPAGTCEAMPLSVTAVQSG